jgi:vacuolar protein sorting-associated protein 3
MFVNLDGDVVRGSIEFHSYPECLVVDGEGIDMNASMPQPTSQEEGYVLAVIRTSKYGAERYGLEIQRWDVDLTEGTNKKEWLNLSQIESGAEIVSSYAIGVRKVISTNEVSIPEISEKLSLKRLRNSAEELQQEEAEKIAVREKEETEITSRLCSFQTQILLWAKDQIWWLVRNPLLVRLDAQLLARVTESGTIIWPPREQVHNLLNDIRGRDPRTEAEYLGLTYIKQKASLMLLIDLIRKTQIEVQAPDNEKMHTEQALLEGGLDPRVVISMLPMLYQEVIQTSDGIWIPGGLREVVELFVRDYNVSSASMNTERPADTNLIQLAKRFLTSWRQKKGLPSIGNEKQVFDTVDAALLRLLLLLDENSPSGPATAGSIRAELNGVIDGGVDCFDRAVELLENSNRLYLLSRLYQSRRNAAKVLATWRRIIEGEDDKGGELINGEQEVRSYLPKIKNSSVVREYATWLANRSPKLGVEVFADDNARVKFEPTEALSILKENAPGAVREYLEHLVFVKKVC